MEVWKIIFLSKSVICRFHVNLPGCTNCAKFRGVFRYQSFHAQQEPRNPKNNRGNKKTAEMWFSLREFYMEPICQKMSETTAVDD